MKKLSELDLYVGPIVGESKETRAINIGIKWKIKDLAREWIKELEKERKIWETNKRWHFHCLSWEGDVIDSKIEFIKEYILEDE